MAKKQLPVSQSTESVIVWGQILLVHFRLRMSNIISSLENMYSMVVFSYLWEGEWWVKSWEGGAEKFKTLPCSNQILYITLIIIITIIIMIMIMIMTT